MPTGEVSSNKETFRRFQDVTNTHDAELISRTIDEIVEPDVLIRTPLPVQASGAQALKEVFARLHVAFPDLHVTVEDLIEEGDKVVGRNSVTGTHRGPYMGVAPTDDALRTTRSSSFDSSTDGSSRPGVSWTSSRRSSSSA